MDLEFERIQTPESVGPSAKGEEAQLTLPEGPPNSITVNLGKVLQVRWHAESGVPLFCFLSVVLLLIFGCIVAICAAFAKNPTWADDVFKFLGQAILTLVGAVVGSAASGAGSSRSRKR